MDDRDSAHRTGLRIGTLRAGWDDEPVMTRPSDDTLLQMVHEALRKAEDAEEGHKRLRAAITGFGERLQDVESCQSSLRSSVTKLSAPQDLTKGVLPTRLVVAWVFSVMAICSMILGAGYSVKSDVRDQATKESAHQELENERYNSQKEAIDDLKKEMALQRIQTESLTKTVISQQRR